MSLDRLNEDRVDAALNFLAQTDNEQAEWKGAVLRAEMKAKGVEAVVYAALTGSIEDKKMQVRLNEDVQKAWDSYFDIVVKDQNCRNQRDRQVLIIELYRSVLSARKAGTIL